MLSLTCLNSEFSFSQSSCPTKVKEHCLPCYFSIARGRIIGFTPFPRYKCYVKCKQPCPGFELELACPFPVMVPITLWAPSYTYCPVSRSHGISWLHFHRGIRVLKSSGIWSTPSLPLFPSPLWPGMIVTVRVASRREIELFNHLTACKQMTDVKLNS